MTDPATPFDEHDAKHQATHGPEKPAPKTKTVRLLRVTARKNMRHGLTKTHWSLIIAGLIVVGVFGWKTAESAAPEVEAQWFYDLKTGQLFSGKSSQVPPISAPSDGQGPEHSGVLAQVIRVEGVSDLRVISLVTYTPEAKELKVASKPGIPPTDNGKIIAGTQVAKPPSKPGDPIVWVGASTGEGQAIFMSASKVADGKPYTVDLP